MKDEVLVEMSNVALRYRYARPRGKRGKEVNSALSGVTLSIHRGEKLGVVGRNGAGKSTLMRVLAGILGADEGTVHHYTHKTLMLSLQVGFKRHLTGRENAVLSGLYQGINKADIGELMPQIEDFAELGEHFDHPMGTYSMGMRSRLGIAIALNCQPELLLLDEVFAVGDRVFKQKSREAIIQKITSENAVVLAAHDSNLISELCDRVLWLEGGQVRELGTSAEVIPKYEEYCKGLETKQRGQ